MYTMLRVLWGGMYTERWGIVGVVCARRDGVFWGGMYTEVRVLWGGMYSKGWGIVGVVCIRVL